MAKSSTSVTVRLSIVALILLMLAATVSPGMAASTQYAPMPPGDFMLFKSDHFDIYYDSTRINESDLNKVVLYSNLAYQNVTAFFGDFEYRDRIILASNHDQYANILYNYLTNENVSESEISSDWGDAERGTIVIVTPDQLPDFKYQLTREFAQIVLRTKLISNKYNLPQWFSDGLATYLAGGPTSADRTLVENACRDGKMMTATQMQEAYNRADDSASARAEAQLAYAQSDMLVSYIVQKYSEENIKYILQDYGSLADLDKAFQRRLGYSPDGICADWQNTLKGELKVKDGVVTAEQLRGYVTGPDGAPQANQSVIFTCMRNDSAALGKVYAATTNESGFYKVNVTYGPFKVQVDRQGFVPLLSSITLQNGEARLYNITLEKAVDPTPTQEPTQGPTQNVVTTPEAGDNTLVYVGLGIVNVLALLVIAVIFLRVRK